MSFFGGGGEGPHKVSPAATGVASQDHDGLGSSQSYVLAPIVRNPNNKGQSESERTSVSRGQPGFPRVCRLGLTQRATREATGRSGLFSRCSCDLSAMLTIPPACTGGFEAKETYCIRTLTMKQIRPCEVEVFFSCGGLGMKKKKEKDTVEARTSAAKIQRHRIHGDGYIMDSVQCVRIVHRTRPRGLDGGRAAHRLRGID